MEGFRSLLHEPTELADRQADRPTGWVKQTFFCDACTAQTYKLGLMLEASPACFYVEMVRAVHFHHFIFDFVVWCIVYIQYLLAQQMVNRLHNFPPLSWSTKALCTETSIIMMGSRNKTSTGHLDVKRLQPPAFLLPIFHCCTSCISL